MLEATLDLIAEEGWANASTQKICKRAGVSRGAQTHHFPTKDSLLIAAVREIVLRYQKEMDLIADSQNDGRYGLEELFDFLWEACFEGNLLNCWMEVMVAARTDNALRPAVLETDAVAIQSMRALAQSRATSGVAVEKDAADIIELTVYLLRGMVVQNGVHHDLDHRRRLFDLWKQLVIR
ncbi:MAG: TetR/AcrR family transcriptional regulator [Henriciella sp.]